MNDLYDAAISAQEAGTLTAWLISYLKESGRNESLAEGLSDRSLHSSGLIDYPIGKYQILMGPDHSYRYYEEPAKYEMRIESMIESLRNGWKPVPLIASDVWNERLELNDGTHRAEALKRFGITSYLTVFYFKSQKALKDFLDSL